MKFINQIAYELRKSPKLKKKIKDAYQKFGDILSDKKSLSKNICQISSNGAEHMFGYYDKCPWSKDEKKIIYLKVEDSGIFTAPNKVAKIIIKNLITNVEEEIASTRAWNVQQGCRLQWLGPDFNTNILYNDFIDNNLKSIIMNVNTKEKKIIDFPTYDIDNNAKFGLSLDFYKLHRLRPGYGYSNMNDFDSNQFKDFCIWQIDYKSNFTKGIITFDDLINIDKKDSMIGAEHKVNHIMINKSGTRFMFLHRWIKDSIKYTRLLTADIDGKNIYNLLDNDLVSHCTWKDDNHILGWAREESGYVGYLLIEDKSDNIERIAEKELNVDGHPSYNSDSSFFITDTYPDFKRKQHIYVCTNDKEVKEVASLYASTKYMNDCRCDLHPRLNYSCNKICFDGTINGIRQVYCIDIDK